MEEQRKRAYRYLLYRAMLDIRPVAWMPLGFAHVLNPFTWRATAARVRRAGVIADWLHNLALFSAIDFERFDEGWFWRDFRNFADRHPDFHLESYEEVFERESSGSGQSAGAQPS